MTAAMNSAADIKVRRMDFEFPDDIPEFWYANDPYRTLLLTALSGTFPEGERFFVDSVRQFQDQVTDPELKKAIRAFIGQEAHHSKEHRVLNEMMERKGYPLSKIDAFGKRGLAYLRKRLSPQRQLAMTCALEHFTAILADQLLNNREEFLDKMDPRVAKIWAWHAIEETEHKAVAFDVFRATVDDEFLFGPDLLVAPVLHQGATERKVYLPAGANWTDAWTGKKFEGGRTIRAAAPLDRIPLYLRNGRALPIRTGA